MPRTIRPRRLLFAAGLLGFVPLVGCSSNRFLVSDGASDTALEGVQVEGYRFRPLAQIPTDFAWKEIEVYPTDQNGLTSSNAAWSFMTTENEYRFVFTKVGYHPAEALVFPDKTLVVSPADDAEWKKTTDARHVSINLPTRNFETVSGRGEILIHLYREEPTTEPAVDPAPAPTPTPQDK